MLKEKINNRELTIGSWITLGSTGVAEILANSGFDWLVVDLEHTTISLEQAGELIRTIELVGVPSLVRLTSNDSNQIKRVLDAGAHGIVVPMVNTADDAINAVAATRYPPTGKRGVGLARAQGYGASFQSYMSWQSEENGGPVVVVQIEHIEAVTNLKEILSIEGVDAFIIGPYDLSCSMGIPGEFEDIKFIETINYIRDTGIKLGISAGIHVVEPDLKLLEKSITEGYNFVAFSVDIRILDYNARKAVKKGREIKK